jgi:hypothetical protein
MATVVAVRHHRVNKENNLSVKCMTFEWAMLLYKVFICMTILVICMTVPYYGRVFSFELFKI